MKCVIYKGTAPFCMRGAWGKLTIESNGIINRVDESAWSLAKKEYASVIEDFKNQGLLEEVESKDKTKYRDSEANKDAKRDAEHKQNKTKNPALVIEENGTQSQNDTQRALAEEKAKELGIAFDSETSTSELKRKIREA